VDEFDPSRPFRTDGCSFANPAACRNVAEFFVLPGGWRFEELPDDPRGGPRERWLWESATAYDIVHAQGRLAGFRDGRLYVFGPFVSPIAGASSGIGLLLVPPDGALPAASSPLLRVVPGPDRALGTDDDGVVGLAWGAAGSGSGADPRSHSAGGAPPGGPGAGRVLRAGAREK
jgi:hypothetical protein